MKKELIYDGFTVVFDNDARFLDDKRTFLLNCINLYASLSNRDVKIVFFNGVEEEKGVTFFFKTVNNEPHEPHA